MTEEEKQARLAEFKKIPRQVQLAVLVALALGVITFIRALTHSYAMHLSLVKAVFYGSLLLFWFFVASVSLYSRSRWGYVGLFLLSAVPLLGLFTFSVHLLRMASGGTLMANWPETIHGLVALTQFVATGVLIRYLLARQVREYVWKAAS